MSYIRIDVSLDEVYDQMGLYEKRDMVEWLHEDGILDKHPNPEIRKLVRGDEESQGEKELRDNLLKIWDSYHRLSNEDEELIKKIANKL
jgi:uncharacterized protein (UPF0305 family)